MLYLVDSGKYTKIDHTFNLEGDLVTLRFYNPDFKLIGYKPGSEEDLDTYRLMCNDYFVDDFEWMKLPKKLHNKIVHDFIVPEIDGKLSLLDIFDLPELNDIEKKVLYYVLKNSGYFSEYEDRVVFHAHGLSNKQIELLDVKLSGSSFKCYLDKLERNGLLIKLDRAEYKLNPDCFNIQKFIDFNELDEDSKFVKKELLRGKV